MKATPHRWWYAAGAALAVTAVTVGGTVAANAGLRPGSGTAAAAPSTAPSAAAPSTAPSAEPSAEPPAAEPSAEAPAARGKVVDTGFGAWVLYGVPMHEAQVPRTTFGVMLGRRLPDGTLTADVMANEVRGSDRAPGFHAGSGAMNVDGRDTPTFGYYAGPAARITARAGGRTVTARTAVWSEDSSITFYWFGPGVAGVHRPRAYDRDGAVLPAGDDGYAVG